MRTLKWNVIFNTFYVEFQSRIILFPKRYVMSQEVTKIEKLKYIPNPTFDLHPHPRDQYINLAKRLCKIIQSVEFELFSSNSGITTI